MIRSLKWFNNYDSIRDRKKKVPLNSERTSSKGSKLSSKVGTPKS